MAGVVRVAFNFGCNNDIALDWQSQDFDEGHCLPLFLQHVAQFFTQDSVTNNAKASAVGMIAKNISFELKYHKQQSPTLS